MSIDVGLIDFVKGAATIMKEEPEEPKVAISYERIFNLGSYEHEKFIISKEVQGEEFLALKNLALQVADFEQELIWFRQSLQLFENIKYQIKHVHYTEEEKVKAEKDLKKVAQVVHEFRTKHKPLSQECKCAYCQAKKVSGLDEE